MNNVSPNARFRVVKRSVWFATACVALVSYLSGCSRSERRPDPTVIRVGVLPDEAHERLSSRRLPLLDYLSSQLRIPCELISADSYEDLLQRFSDNEIELAYFGGLTFLKAHHADGAIPLVMRDVDRDFSSYFLVRSESDARELTDCRRMTLSFGDELSTSGHLMPRHFLLEESITPEAFFAEVAYSGAHDATVLHVRDGLADVGVANAKVVDQMYADGIVQRNDIRVLWETPPYVDYVWAVQARLTPSLRRRIRNAFLSLSMANSEQNAILEREQARSFLPATLGDFRELTSIAIKLGLLDRKN